MIYVFHDIKNFSDNMYEKGLTFLPNDRIEKLSRYVKMIDRKLGMIAYLLLLIALKNKYAFDKHARYKFEFEINGKPYLKSHPEINFNLSHCHSAVACAISDSQIGIDVEMIVKNAANIVGLTCCENEKRYLSEMQNADLMFTKLWTLKESYLKCTGKGISGDLSSIDFSYHEDEFCKLNKHFKTVCRSDYILSVCGNKLDFDIQSIDLCDILQIIDN